MLSHASPAAKAAGAPVPRLAIVVVVYDMQREAPRTLYSLSAAYQVAAPAEDYEIIVVDNGSARPLPAELFETLDGRFRYFYLEDAPASPAMAVNFGVAHTRAVAIGVMIDGARIASPGVIGQCLAALDNFANPVICTLAFHLGSEMQTKSIAKGYDKDVEDRLLDDIDWKNNGYRLFEISSLAGSSKYGWLGPIAESNLIIVRQALFDGIDGMDERFDLPGGGFVNLDFYNRAVVAPDTQLVSLFGEGTFHQVHGGIMTNRAQEKVSAELKFYSRQYRDIRGVEFKFATWLPALFAAPDYAFQPGLRHASRLTQLGSGPE